VSPLTAKQAADKVRKSLPQRGEGPWRISNDNGLDVTLPAGIIYRVRATKNGVNITLEDYGFINRITGGNRHALDEHRDEMAVVVAAADQVRRMFEPPLPGETKWGVIVLSAEPTTVTTHRRDGSEVTEDWAS
jgi:hypothetical protein